MQETLKISQKLLKIRQVKALGGNNAVNVVQRLRISNGDDKSVSADGKARNCSNICRKEDKNS